jgi:hypothetical protein
MDKNKHKGVIYRIFATMNKIIPLFLFMLTASCTNDRPWRVIEIKQDGELCKYTLSRGTGFGPQLKEITDTCGKYYYNQIIQNKDL